MNKNKPKFTVLLFSYGTDINTSNISNSEYCFEFMNANEMSQKQLLTFISYNKPKVIVADIFRSGFDILHMIDYIGKIYKYNPIIIATGDIINNNMINNVLTAGCNHYMKYPIHTDSLISTILMLSKVAIINAITSTPADSKNNKNIDITVSLDKMLSDIGIPYNILGRKFITDAVIYIMKYCGGYLSGIHITKDIYPYVAEKNKTTSPRVERNIRHAIERAYNSNHSAENINKYFGNSYSWNRDKPTNAEFLSCVCNKLLLEYGMEV